MHRERYLRRLGVTRCGEVLPDGIPPAESRRSMTSALSWTEEQSCSSDSEASTDHEEHELVRKRARCSSAVSTFHSMRDEHEHGHARRMKFLQKLSYQGVWLPTPQRPPSHQTVIIFDWDDTLLCTTYLRAIEGQYSSPCTERHLQACEEASAQLLELALSLGQTFIITNAMGGWVEASAKCWAPSLVPLIDRVNLVSARSQYEADFPFSPMRWKAEAFLEVQRQLHSQAITNIVVLGDAEYEMAAGQAMAQGFRHASIKLVKFTEDPCPSELLKELKLVLNEFPQIVARACDVKVRLRRPAPFAAGGG